MYLPDHTGSIGVFDSGIGGLSVANAISGLLPRESMLYVADNAHAPYGKRSDAEVLDYSRRITDFLLAAGTKIIVVACNTATSVAIDCLREEHPDVPFVGLEPAVKPAAAGRRVGVIATAVTLRSPRYLALKDKYLVDRPVWENACVGLVPLIEAFGPGSPEVALYLKELFAQAGELDTLVLGCTHYPLISKDIANAIGDRVTIIEPSSAAARQVLRLLDGTSPRVDEPDGIARYDFYCTGGSAPLQRTLGNLRELNAARRWVMPYLAP